MTIIIWNNRCTITIAFSKCQSRMLTLKEAEQDDWPVLLDYSDNPIFRYSIPARPNKQIRCRH